jgi:hypothetical protein
MCGGGEGVRAATALDGGRVDEALFVLASEALKGVGAIIGEAALATSNVRDRSKADTGCDRTPRKSSV